MRLRRTGDDASAEHEGLSSSWPLEPSLREEVRVRVVGEIGLVLGGFRQRGKARAARVRFGLSGKCLVQVPTVHRMIDDDLRRGGRKY